VHFCRWGTRTKQGEEKDEEMRIGRNLGSFFLQKISHGLCGRCHRGTTHRTEWRHLQDLDRDETTLKVPGARLALSESGDLNESAGIVQGPPV
jgi:hypothetical protein